MPDRETLDRIKRATVAMAFFPKERPADDRKAPFVIIGSGFCIHPRGLIATCEHVISAFVHGDIREVIARVTDEDKKKELWPLRNLEMQRPEALFFDTRTSQDQVIVFPAPMETAVAKTNADVGLVRVGQHVAFKNGYSFLEFEDYSNVYEGMEIATCGFPLGNFLHEQMGTVTSSFTRGILSSTIPAPGADIRHVTGFQLNLTATFGNSGGPVFNWANGKVIGILQGAPVDPKGNPLHGFARAEPVYKLNENDMIQRALNMSIEDIAKRSR